MNRQRVPRIGLALSGGGARGLAHIGVLKVLEQEGVPVDLLAGTSMGGVVAAAYAAGLTPEFMAEEALRMTNPRRLLSLADPTLPRRGLFEGQKVIDYLTGHLGECTFENLRCPLCLVAVNLENSEAVVLNEGRVLDAVRATIALPGLFKPVERDEQLLVDGGLLDNLPADVARRMGADTVIAVDVIGGKATFSAMLKALREHRYMPAGLASTFEVMLRSLDVMMREINQRRLAEAAPEIIIRPNLPEDVSVLLGFTRAADTIASGERAATEALPDIRRVLEELGA
ncbi:MAG: patatin-like phospholipase family protein [Anaerolineae bacterium]